MWTPILAGALGALLVVPASANPDAEAACASFNLTTKIGLMHVSRRGRSESKEKVSFLLFSCNMSVSLGPFPILI